MKWLPPRLQETRTGACEEGGPSTAGRSPRLAHSRTFKWESWRREARRACRFPPGVCSRVGPLQGHESAVGGTPARASFFFPLQISLGAFVFPRDEPAGGGERGRTQPSGCYEQPFLLLPFFFFSPPSSTPGLLFVAIIISLPFLHSLQSRVRGGVTTSTRGERL